MKDLNDKLSQRIFGLRTAFLEKHPARPIGKVWKGISAGKTTITMILPTRGCYWALSQHGGCSMCGYINDSARGQVSSEIIMETVEEAVQRYHSTKEPLTVKIFNSGSFFDNSELTNDLRKGILTKLQDNFELSKVSVESRPEFILNNSEELDHIRKMLGKTSLEVGIGLETSNDKIRRNCINKGFSFSDFRKAVSQAKSLDVLVKAYLLIKPPFLKELEAIYDSIRSAEDAVAVGVETISFNPCTVASGTLTESMWKRSLYRPPWLWSIFQIVNYTKKSLPGTRVLCEPMGGGKLRGPHNCGECDWSVLGAIRHASESQDQEEDLPVLNCNCKDFWKEAILAEVISGRRHPIEYDRVNPRFLPGTTF